MDGRLIVVKVLFFLPSLNDQHGLDELVRSLLQAFPHSRVLVVDDGSDPPIHLTIADPAERARVELLRLEFNVGLGLATSVALDHFLASNFDFLLRLDADGQHPLSEIQAMLAPLQNCVADVVWGERSNHLRSASIREVMATATKMATAWVGQIIFRSPVHDWFTGFFALNREAAQLVAAVQLERYCEVQLLCISHSNRLKIVTHSIEQLEREHGESRIQLSDGVMIFLRSALMMVLYALRMQPR